MFQRIQINLKFEELSMPIDSLLKVVLITICLIHLTGFLLKLLTTVIEITSHMV